MDSRTFSISLGKNPIVSIEATPGHFSTSLYHTNYYLDLSTLKANAMVARDVARELAAQYVSTALVETIVCMENTKVIGAFIAQELLQEGPSVINSGGNINVITPMTSIDGKLIFYDNELDWIRNKHILLLTASISSGWTLNRALECISYYDGIVSGISALFCSYQVSAEQKIHTLFTSDDISGYKVFETSECDLCKTGQKLEAIISSEGYKKI